MATAGLGWNLQDLSDASGISWRTVQKIAKADGVPRSSAQTVAAIETALQEAGAVFLAADENGAGVRLKKRNEA